jgi:hypothetical protein
MERVLSAIRCPVARSLGLGQPEEERSPPPDIRYVPVHEEGREIAGV